MRQCMNANEKVYVKSFSGSTIKCMDDYIKPSMRYNPAVVLLHVGTNDLHTNKSSEVIANEIITLYSSIKNSQNEVIISNIIIRNDPHNIKGLEVNTILKSLCEEKIYLIL